MGKSSSPPPAPDYAGAATATAQGNLDATRAATQANRIDQYTPYGSLTYSQKPTGAIDYGAYNQALQDYNKAMSSYQSSQAPRVDPENTNIFQRLSPQQGGGSGTPFQGVAPKPENFMKYNPDSGWQQTVNLSPTGQKLLDYQNNAALGLGEQTGQALGRVDQSLSQPFDYSSVGDVQRAAEGAVTSRLDPMWDRRTSQEETKLINQGLQPGSEAYKNAMSDLNMGRNDAYQQAVLAGINTMPQTYQMAQALRSQPLNELNALRTGSQVQNPTFQQAPQQQTTAGANQLGAMQMQGQAGLDAYNAQAAQQGNFTSGLMGLAGTGAMAFAL